MFKGGRNKDVAWGEFEKVCKVLEENGKEVRTYIYQCKHCAKEVSGKIERLKAHLQKCTIYLGLHNSPNSDSTMDSSHSDEGENHMTSRASNERSNTSSTEESSKLINQQEIEDNIMSVVSLSSESTSTEKKRKRLIRTPTLDKFVINTTPSMQSMLDLQFARAFYACNIPFSAAEDPEMKKLVEMLRGGTYTPPTRRYLSTQLLDEVTAECEASMVKLLQGVEVTMVQDGWSNIHNHPIIATCLHTATRIAGKKSFFTGSVDAGSEIKTAEYIANIAEAEIDACEAKYKCRVVAYVSDNEAKMNLTRTILKERFKLRLSEGQQSGRDLIVYGCGAHYFNLIEKEVTPHTVMKHLVEISKFFRNHHQPAGWLREKKGLKPQLPNDTRWNSQNDCVDVYIKNFPLYIQIRNEQAEIIAEKHSNIVSLIDNIGIHREALYLQKQLQMVSKALDRFQSDSCSLGDAVDVWYGVLLDPIIEPYKPIIEKRFEDWVTPFHLLAYASHPKYKGKHLTEDQDKVALQWLTDVNPDFITYHLQFDIEDETVYPKIMYSEKTIESLPVGKWWKVMKNKAIKHKKLSVDFCNLMIRIHSLPTSTAAVERLFSSYGYIHSKIRNRLGNTKAEKLVKCYRMLKTKDEHVW